MVKRAVQTRSVIGRLAALMCVVVASSFVGVGVAAAPGDMSLRGVFAETAAGSDAGYDLTGTANMTVGSDGTSVNIVIAGLDPAKVYGSHLHNDTCASGGGGHYQDVEGGDTTPPNELWVTNTDTTLTSNANGVATASGSAVWQARLTTETTNARSIVVHEPGGTRIGCADLRQQEVGGQYSGMSGIGGSVARLYMAVFQRPPDASGHEYWLAQADAGASLMQIGQFFVASPEFMQTYDDLDDASFVGLIYNNVMGRQGDSEGVAFWTGQLAGGAPRAWVALAFSESPEFMALTGTS